MKRILCMMLALALLLPLVLPLAEAAQDAVVIVLDPGHGGLDSGISKKYDGKEVWESALALKIAEYCRDYLLAHYENVEVHLTRETDKKVSLEDRVRFADEHEADFMLSIHINADEGYARGALAIVPRGRYHPEQGKASKETAEAILERMEVLGMKNLGTTVQLGTNRYPDGTYVDAFAVIRGCVRENIPCIIMEHGFLDNEDDYREFLSTPEQLAALGEADALGLAETLGLEEKPQQTQPAFPFDDVPDGAWFREAAAYVWTQGLMQGISKREFGPAMPANRAMVVTLLYRLEGVELRPETSSFDDVEPGSWYHASVEWAKDNGITTGVSETEFAPGRNVIREQFVTFLHRYAGEPEPDGLPEYFADWADVSGYAQKAVAWAVETGLLTGYDDGTVGPLRELNRAELAVLMQRFHRWYCGAWEEEVWTLSHTRMSLCPGETFELSLTNQYGEAADVLWFADCDGVVELDGSTVTAVGGGTALLRGEWDGALFECLVEVREEEVTWRISHEDVTIKVGESFSLRLRSSGGETASVTWTASKSGYVTISGNKITGKARGTVTVSCEHEGVAYECIVRVKAA